MTTPTASPPAPVAVRIARPSLLETCDRCGAAALWRIHVAGGELLFCGHDAVKAGLVKIDVAHAAYRNENRQKGSSS